MKKITIVILVIVSVVLTVVFLRQKNDALENRNNLNAAVNTGQNGEIHNREKSIEVIADRLNIPWELVFLPDKSILVTERRGNIIKIGSEAARIPVPGVVSAGEGGLLGMVIHPEFSQNRWIYLYLTVREGDVLKNVVVRYVFSGSGLSGKKIIIDNIPAGSNHNGGRIAFGPDGFLYVTTGDSGKTKLAQNIKSLAGKILRVKDDGTVPDDNPFGNAVYSFGHRNSQGIVWDGEGRLWATEHGRSGKLSGYDELNLIEKGANYGWPEIQGDETRSGMKKPVIHSGASKTWAPGGAAYADGSIFFTGLRGQTLYEYKISENKITEHFKGEYGRLRGVTIDPDGNFYIFTNNTDGRGKPGSEDDRIIKISSNFFPEM